MTTRASSRENILEYLVGDLLPSIVEGGTFSNTVKTVERGHRSPRDMGEHEFPAIFVVTTDETRENITHNQFNATLSVVIVGYVRDSSGNPNLNGTKVQKDLDRLIADITCAIETDRLQGGLVHTTEVTEISTDDGDIMPIGGCAMTVEFKYVSEGAAP